MAIVAITGRPNVGKSTLFNRLIGGRKAIVDDISGVTRDRNYGNSDWNGKGFTVIDTGGFVANSDDVFEKAIREQVVIAMEEADVVIFMVDVSTGITDLDQQMADVLRKSGKEIILVVNKVDNTERLYESNDFYSLGFKELYPVASISGSGTGELLDKVVQMLPEDMEDEHGDLPRFAIIGQPNVGKSSLLNALIGEERNIVTEIPGTTRDSIHTHYNLYNKDFILIDTAGVRKKA
ncbi:MAG: ribosome biogenesis GTPase Der, partial [Bacteroidetes bacterium]|nr:ribosome biogenesis GTPase Der [Bacteroidota bacterium]